MRSKIFARFFLVVFFHRTVCVFSFFCFYLKFESYALDLSEQNEWHEKKALNQTMNVDFMVYDCA